MDPECAFEHADRRPPYMKGSARPMRGCLQWHGHDLGEEIIDKGRIEGLSTEGHGLLVSGLACG